jgi:hypothetical protein
VQPTGVVMMKNRVSRPVGRIFLVLFAAICGTSAIAQALPKYEIQEFSSSGPAGTPLSIGFTSLLIDRVKGQVWKCIIAVDANNGTTVTRNECFVLGAPEAWNVNMTEMQVATKHIPLSPTLPDGDFFWMVNQSTGDVILCLPIYRGAGCIKAVKRKY